MNTMREERLGTVWNGKYGTFKVIEYRRSNDIDIQFLDEFGFIARHIQWSQRMNTINPYVRPYEKTVRNVGYLGTFKDGTIPLTNTKEYDCWYNMLTRCYSVDGTVKVRKDGTVVTVSDRWKCYTTFLEDIKNYENYNEWLNSESREMHLDKDILSFLGQDTTKIVEREYSFNTCHFIPIAKNSIFTRVTRAFYNGEVATIGIYSYGYDKEEENDFMPYEEVLQVLDSSSLGSKQQREENRRLRALKEHIYMIKMAIDFYKHNSYMREYVRELQGQLRHFETLLHKLEEK